MDERAKLIGEALELVWGSLVSHIEYTYTDSPDGREFHLECIREYNRLITILVQLY